MSLSVGKVILVSRIHGDRQNDCRVGPTEIEHMGRKVDLLVGEARQQASLNVQLGLVGLVLWTTKPVRNQSPGEYVSSDQV
jgi:hypothetical protein